jgi:hypothetical protein
MSSGDREPQIARTGPFRHPGIGVGDSVVGEHRPGHDETLATPETGGPGAIAPPPSRRPVPKGSLAERLRARLEGKR